ncbi:hypothetical protein R5W23_000134 [Gemmata sp. JC673]|uniref:Uncharacterized protein n=1 Tax=Gemmata algarum TaxID=2975278 RepID=A0ABU5ESI9_9BACT|nr:hypothetical protein [Gemmata algarum]MDY3557607.1 hypothetical protein [Gemmata algarum]
MDIVYNGIHLSMGTINEYRMEAVYDDTKTDYLYTRHRVSGVCTVNGQSEVRDVAGPPVSYRKTDELVYSGDDAIRTAPSGVSRAGAAVPPNVNVPLTKVFHSPSGDEVFGDAPPSGLSARSPNAVRQFKLEPVANPVPLTVRAIRERLLTPRKPLFVFAGSAADSELLLMSPARFSYHTDARNGPQPISCEILSSQGDADTFIIQFDIETCVRESEENLVSTDPNAGSVASPLLSNRFSMIHSIDDQHLTKIIVEGEAVFRSDLLYSTAASPDDLRQRLLLPCPFGFVRDGIVVEGFRDGTGVRYRFEDRQLPVHLPGAAVWGAVRIEATHSQAIVSDADLVKGTAAVFNDLNSQLLNSRWLKQANESQKEPTKPTAPETSHSPALPPAKPAPIKLNPTAPTKGATPMKPSRVTVPRSPRLR